MDKYTVCMLESNWVNDTFSRVLLFFIVLQGQMTWIHLQCIKSGVSDFSQQSSVCGTTLHSYLSDPLRNEVSLKLLNAPAVVNQVCGQQINTEHSLCFGLVINC